MKAALRHRASVASFDTIDVAQKVEEVKLSWYSPQDFYPVKIGETFKSRYQVVGKLGYESYAAVWLCRNIREFVLLFYALFRSSSDLPCGKHKYVAITFCKRECLQATREKVLKHLNSIKSSHNGFSLVRRLLDSFEIVGTGGRHQCLVHEPLGTGVSYFRSLLPSRRLPQGLLQALLVHVLQA
jgi:serine/threonine-protein kinase SRPK3